MNRCRGETGYSLVEVLVGITLFSALSIGFYQVMISSTRGAQVARGVSRVSEEARLGFTRMVRDTREADSVVSASSTSFTIRVNYDGDANYEALNEQGDSEIITYAYDAATESITLNGQPLMRGVTPIPGTPARDIFSFSSNALEYDWSGDAVTTWQELNDAACHGVVGVGDCDSPRVLNEGEWPHITTVEFDMRVTVDGRTADFQATAQMRNRIT